MSRLALQTIDLAIAHLPPELLSPAQAGGLRAAAHDLAPGQQLYFEVRLAGEDRAIDVSQHFYAESGGAAALLALAARGSSPAWRRIADFARAWPRLPAIAEIGLEHDAGIATPAVFAAFATGMLADRAAGQAFVEAVAPDALPGWRHALAALETAEACGLTGGRMIGAMLSRDGQLRAMVRGLSPAGLAGFLDAAGWPGDRAAMLGLLGTPALMHGATRLVLGFAPEMAADWGIEVIHARDAAGEAGRRALLAWLVEAGLAEPGRVAALAAWTGAITPVDARADWPDAMILDDLRSGRRSRFAAFVSHVKINVEQGRARPAKAYLSLAPVPADA
ncbi:MAG: hypothetical protein WDN24_16750 [Sphingomonas sp.]